MKRHFSIIFYLLIICICLSFSGCAKKANLSSDKITVAVSIVPQETFVKAVSGDRFNVVTMVPPGKSPESYSPTPQEMESFSNASLYFSIGIPAEQQNILAKAKDFNKNIKIIDVAKEVSQVYPDRFFDEHEGDHKEDTHQHEGRDPHIWLSPKRVVLMIDMIVRELSTLDPDNKALYEKNASAGI